jgi:hypothetical protein
MGTRSEVHSLGEISELEQKTDEARHGDALEQRLRVILLGRSIELGIRQPVFIPNLVPQHRHC